MQDGIPISTEPHVVPLKPAMCWGMHAILKSVHDTTPNKLQKELWHSLVTLHFPAFPIWYSFPIEVPEQMSFSSFLYQSTRLAGNRLLTVPAPTHLATAHPISAAKLWTYPYSRIVEEGRKKMKHKRHLLSKWLPGQQGDGHFAYAADNIFMCIYINWFFFFTVRTLNHWNKLP